MTPVAITPAARTAAKKRAAGAPAVPGHRRRLRPQPAPKAPRRISGPLRGRLDDPAAPFRPSDARGTPRRTPRRTPARAPARAPRRAGRASRRAGLPLLVRVLAFARALPDHPLLDRLIRGRAWIPLLGVMLAGIVAMQVEVLKLGTSIGRSIERGATLQSRNDQLRMAVAALDGDQRIERLAAAGGMIMPAPAAVGFLSSRSRVSVHSAIANIHAPDTARFLSLNASNGAVASVTTAASSQAASSGLSTQGASSPTASTATPVSTSSSGTTSSGTTSSGTTSSGTTSSGQSTASSGQGTVTGTTPVGTGSSQASSGGAGIPVGG